MYVRSRVTFKRLRRLQQRKGLYNQSLGRSRLSPRNFWYVTDTKNKDSNDNRDFSQCVNQHILTPDLVTKWKVSVETNLQNSLRCLWWGFHQPNGSRNRQVWGDQINSVDGDEIEPNNVVQENSERGPQGTGNLTAVDTCVKPLEKMSVPGLIAEWSDQSQWFMVVVFTLTF